MIRKLTSLAKGFYNAGKWYVSFAYYEKDKFDCLRWTGDSESCELTEDELYEIVKPRLRKEHTEVQRR
jgi:hypothetical protein